MLVVVLNRQFRSWSVDLVTTMLVLLRCSCIKLILKINILVFLYSWKNFRRKQKWYKVGKWCLRESKTMSGRNGRICSSDHARKRRRQCILNMHIIIKSPSRQRHNIWGEISCDHRPWYPFHKSFAEIRLKRVWSSTVKHCIRIPVIYPLPRHKHFRFVCIHLITYLDLDFKAGSSGRKSCYSHQFYLQNHMLLFISTLIL